MKTTKTSRLNREKSLKKSKKRSVNNDQNVDFAHTLETAKTALGKRAPMINTPVQISSLEAAGSLLALQNVPKTRNPSPNKMPDKQLYDHGLQILEALERIRVRILEGSVSEEELIKLRKMLKSHHNKNETSALNTLIEEIELRAEIEIVKITSRTKNT